MPAMHPELEPFYGPLSPFAVDLVRQGAGEPAPFRGVLSEADQEAFQGYIAATVAELRWPTGTATLSEGDSVAQVSLDPATGEILATVRTFRVTREGRRVIDGLESLALLTEQTEA